MKVTKRLLSAVLTIAAIVFAISASPVEAHDYRVRTNRITYGAFDSNFDSPCNYGNRTFINRRGYPVRRIRRFNRWNRDAHYEYSNRYNRHNRFDRFDRSRVGIVVRF